MELPVSIIFDCSGTLIKMNRVIKNILTQKYVCNIQTVDIVDKKEGNALVIMKNKINIMDLNPNEYISNLLTNAGYGISYCNPPIIKDNILKDNTTKIKELQDAIQILKKFNVKTNYGHAVIIDTTKGKITHTISTGGTIFPEVPNVINSLKEKNINIFIASGDSRYTVNRLCQLPTDKSVGLPFVAKRRAINSEGIYSIQLPQ